jgi:hypothetical protein
MFFGNYTRIAGDSSIRVRSRFRRRYLLAHDRGRFRLDR